jgi:hypothetical protein
MRWSRRSGTTRGEKIIDKIDYWKLAIDNERYLYVTDVVKHEVKRYRMGETTGTVVVDGNGQGEQQKE